MTGRLLRQARAAGLAISLLVGATAQAQDNRVFGIGQPEAVTELPAGEFRDSLLALPPQSRARAMATLRSTSTPAADFEFMRVDRRGGILYVDPAPDGAIESGPEEALAEPIVEADVFSLHSKPGASKVLYVDFDGHELIGTVWNGYSGQEVLYMLPFDLDGSPSSFSQAELNRIAESWRRVTEDFAAFDIDVTTEEPPFTIDPSTGRVQYASNVGHNLVTRERDANGYYVYAQGGCGCGCGCGGVAYLNVFGNSYYQPGLTFNSGLGSNALTISHETGHNLGLSHDGSSGSGYYGGHGSGETSWGPIMGAPWGRSLTAWSRGDYPNANNPEDDYAIISNYLPRRSDDHEDVVLGAATPLIAPDGTSVVSGARVSDPPWADLANKGIIEDPNDFDLFSMSVGTGWITLSIDPAKLETYEGSQGANLDIQARLLDSVGTVLQTSNPDLSVGANINYEVTVAGDYYLEITGVGRPGTGGSDLGHSDYAAIGQYYINGTIPPQVEVTDPPVPPDRVFVTLVGDNSIEFSWTDNNLGPEANEAGYHVFRSTDGGASFGKVASLPRDSEFYADNNLVNGTYIYKLQLYNSMGTVESAETEPVSIDIPLVAVVTSESTALGSVVSGSYFDTRTEMFAQALSEEHSGGRPSLRQTYLDHSWVVTGVAPAVSVVLEVVASAPGNGEFDDFVFHYSLDGQTWEPVGEGILEAGTGSKTFIASLPPTTEGSAVVRVQDTDRTTGSSNTDTVSVSLIRVTSYGDAADQPPTVTITAPADGTSVKFGDPVDLSAEAYDFEDTSLTISWTSDLDDYLGTGATASATLSIGTHTITATVTDSAKQTATESITVTVSDDPTAQSMSVSDLVGFAEAKGKGGNWLARVTILVEDNLGGAVSGATVNGVWSGNAAGSASCVTDAAGLCSVEVTLKRGDTLVSFTVTGITGALSYYEAGNAESEISVSAP